MPRFRQPVKSQLAVLRAITRAAQHNPYRTTEIETIRQEAKIPECPKVGDMGQQVVSDCLADLWEQGEIVFYTESWRDYCYPVPADFQPDGRHRFALKTKKPFGIFPRPRRIPESW